MAASPAQQLRTTAHWKAALINRLRDNQTPAAGIVGAAHAASPATGQGASMALEDAAVLAKSAPR